MSTESIQRDTRTLIGRRAMLRSRVLGLLLALGMLAIGAAAKYSHSRAKMRGGLPAREYRVAKYSQTVRALSSVAVPIPAPAPANSNATATDFSLLGSLPDLAGLPIASPSTAIPIPPSAADAANLLPQRLVQGADSALPAGRSALLLPPAGAQTESTALAGGLDAVGLPAGLRSFQFVDTPVLRIDHCSISEISVQMHDTGVWTVSLRADQNPIADELDDRTKKVTTAEPTRKFTEHLRGNQFFVRVQCFANHGSVAPRSLLGRPKVIPLHVEPFWVQKGVPLPLVVQGYSRHVRAYFRQIDRVEMEFYYRIE